VCNILKYIANELMTKIQGSGALSFHYPANEHDVAVCCSVLQYVAVYCSVLQCVAICCSVLQYVAVYCGMLQCND